MRRERNRPTWPERYRYRWLLNRDHEAVVSLLTECLGHPLDEHLPRARLDNLLSWVVQCGESVVAYVCYTRKHNCLEIASMVVSPSHQRCGIGKLIVDELKAKRRVQTVVVCVPEANLGAQLFFKSQSFTAVEILSTHFASDGDAAYKMVWTNDDEG